MDIMKRIYITAVIAALLLAGCGAVNEPASKGADSIAAESAAETSSPDESTAEEKDESSEDTSEDESAAESSTESIDEVPDSAASDESTASDDSSEAGSFPGGLDDDGREGNEVHFTKETGFAPGVWWSTGEGADSYYQFNTDGTGIQVWQSDGFSREFSYRMDGGKFYKRFGTDPEMLASAEAKGNSVMLNYTVTGGEEKLEYMGNISLDDFKFYTNDTLAELGKEYYRMNSEDHYEPEFAEAFQAAGDDRICIHLYDVLDGHASTATWYYVDRFTGKGEDIMENKVDLTEAVKGQGID